MRMTLSDPLRCAVKPVTPPWRVKGLREAVGRVLCRTQPRRECSFSTPMIAVCAKPCSLAPDSGRTPRPSPWNCEIIWVMNSFKSPAVVGGGAIWRPGAVDSWTEVASAALKYRCESPKWGSVLPSPVLRLCADVGRSRPAVLNLHCLQDSTAQTARNRAVFALYSSQCGAALCPVTTSSRTRSSSTTSISMSKKSASHTVQIDLYARVRRCTKKRRSVGAHGAIRTTPRGFALAQSGPNLLSSGSRV